MAAEDRTMFEIYRDSDYNCGFHYIFYTELEEHGRDGDIAKAASGTTVFSGFLDDSRKEPARTAIIAIVDELNDMDADDAGMASPEIEQRLVDFLVTAPSQAPA